LMNLFAVIPALANQATLSFESVIVPDASVTQCILDFKRESSMGEADSIYSDLTYRSKDSLNKTIRSCY
jgi:hypothetical protein